MMCLATILKHLVCSVVKMILILSHGNATVNIGFSVYGSILVENLHEQSVD